MLGLLALAMGGVLAGSFFLQEDEGDGSDTAQEDAEVAQDSEANLVDVNLLDDEALQEITTLTGEMSSHTFIGDDADSQVVLDTLPSRDSSLGYTNIIGSDAIYVADEDELIHIDLGAGDDLLVVRNGTAIIVTGDGADTVDAYGLAAGEIHAGPGDVVHGSDVVSEIYGTNTTGTLAVNAHSAEFYGGDANEVAVATGNDAFLDGGSGNDQLAAFEGHAQLHGGAGDDWLIGNATSDHFDQNSRVSDINSVTNASFDTLNGGDGDDHLLLSNGDVGTGGEGADSFEVYHSVNRSQVAANILDFSPSEDALVIYVAGSEPDQPDDASFDLADRVALSDLANGTEILVDDTVVATIDGVTELRVGIPLVGLDDSDIETGDQYFDILTGESAGIDTFDIIVKTYPARSS